MLLNYNHLYYFHVAAVEGSVAAAAQRLGVTQPTVSEQLRALEQTLGTALFERTPTGLRLTEAGRRAFLHTTRMFAAGEAVANTLGHDAPRAAALLRVGVSSGLPRSMANEYLLRLIARGRWIASTRYAECVDLLRSLRTGQLDLVLCEIEPSLDMRRGLDIEVVDRIQLAVVAPSDLAVAGDWSALDLVQFRPNSPYRWVIAEFLQTRGLRPRVVAESDDALFLVAAAIHRRCVAIVPESAARTALDGGELRLVDSLESSLAVHALYQGSTLARSAVSRLRADKDESC